MPVRKYRSVDEMPSAAFCARLDPGNLKLACELSAIAFRLVPRRFPRGLHRYRSVDSASEQREAWERSFTDTGKKEYAPERRHEF